MGLFDSPYDYDAQTKHTLNVLREYVQEEVAREVERRLKDWEPTQNIRLTVAVETADKK